MMVMESSPKHVVFGKSVCVCVCVCERERERDRERELEGDIPKFVAC